jgi:putative heme-binding domain-containing protein
MTPRHFITVMVTAGVLYATGAVAQPRSGTPVPAANPFQDDATAIRNGEAIFLARCASCHGRDARGLTGPDLTGLWARGTTDAQLFQTVQRGVPGTEMPPFDTRSQLTEVWETLAYLRTVNVTETGGEVATGDSANGERLFRTHCSGCHIVKGSGGILGPDLSRIGSSRPRAALAARIRGTSSAMVSGYEPVTLVTASGQTVRGVKKNEDDFSIQIMDVRGRLQGYVKSALSKLTYERQSIMPAYGADRLSDGDLEDLLRYLGTLRMAATRR